MSSLPTPEQSRISELRRLRKGVERHGICWLLIDSHRRARRLNKDSPVTSRGATALHQTVLVSALDDLVAEAMADGVEASLASGLRLAKGKN